MGISDYVKKGMEKADELADSLKEKAEDAMESVAPLTENLKEKAGAAMDQAGEWTDNLKEKASDAFGGDSYLEKAQDLYAMCGEGKMMDAFEKYYHDDVVMIEATGETTEGKAANREREMKWMENVQEMHGFGHTATTANEEDKVTMCESWMEVTFKDGNRMKLEQVAVQRWEGDHIIHERFYYNAP